MLTRLDSNRRSKQSPLLPPSGPSIRAINDPLPNAAGILFEKRGSTIYSYTAGIGDVIRQSSPFYGAGEYPYGVKDAHQIHLQRSTTTMPYVTSWPPVAAEESDATRGVQHKPAVMPRRAAAISDSAT